MTDVNKAITPVQSLTISPLNEGPGGYGDNSYIQFKIGASDLSMWLVNNSYLKLDLEYTRAAWTPHDSSAASTTASKTYIRNANFLFRMVEVLYGGKPVYIMPYNIEQNVIKMLDYGESYMNANFATFTTTKMIEDGIAYLQFDNGTTGTKSGDHYANIAARTATITDIMIPINQILPIFQDCTSNGFPVKNFKSQLEIRLYVAEPRRYLVDYDPNAKDFSDKLWVGTQEQTSTIEARYGSGSVKLKNVRLYASNYIPNPSESAVIDDKVNSTGLKMKYSLIQSGLRNQQIRNGPNIIPFTVSTNNVTSLMLYCYRKDLSPSLMYRPYINDLYIKFGTNQLPFQPIGGDSFDSPHEFKFTTDDVLNALDTYFSETNNDYNRSYRQSSAPSYTDNVRDGLSVPESSFVMMGANYVNDPSDMGSNSSRWHSQYQAHFSGKHTDVTDLTFVLAVKTEYGLILKDGDLSTINI